MSGGFSAGEGVFYFYEAMLDIRQGENPTKNFFVGLYIFLIST